MKYLIIQSKGGVGKSFLAKLLYLKAEKENIATAFLDADQNTDSLHEFFHGIKDRKPKNIKYKKVKLLGEDKKIVRDRFNEIYDVITTEESYVVDLGADSSQQFLNYVEENNLLQDLEKAGLTFLLILCGGTSIDECLSFYEKFKKVEGIGAITKVVANEKDGGVKGQSVTEFTKADKTLKVYSTETEPQMELNALLTKGCVYEDFNKLHAVRRSKLFIYLADVFKQF